MKLKQQEIDEAVATYDRAVARGCEPVGGVFGQGRPSALAEGAREIGVDRGTMRHRLRAGGVYDRRDAKPVAALADPPAQGRPRIRVKAGSSPAGEGAPLLPGGILPSAAYLSGPVHSFTTEADNTFTFGACGDQHLGSKYSRLDVLESLYDAFAEAGCKTVFNTGNWIDGEARFNVHDLIVRGMDAQVRYLAKVYPQRPGITTYAVTGDDHEGWYAQREGVDIGRYAADAFRRAGRSDWVDLGYMEAPVGLVNKHSGKVSIISVVHPGGGSSYALSYAIQKIIESLDGGEKPSIGLYGHYHKLWSGNIRNVWCVQTGTTEDQTPFMRKKKLEAHVGGYICKATMDPRTGAIVRFSAECLRFFNKGYYAGRWSHSGPVNQSERVLTGLAA